MKSFLFSILLSAVVPLSGCASTEIEHTGRFSDATPAQLELVLEHLALVELIQLGVPLVAVSHALETGCPEVVYEDGVITAIHGNGCTAADNSVYEGSVVLEVADGHELASISYREFRFLDQAGNSLSLDGSLQFARAGDSALRYELVLDMELAKAGDPLRYALEADLAATCQEQGTRKFLCTLDRGSQSYVDGVGSFGLEGEHSLGETGMSTVLFHGAETMHAEYDPQSGCVIYTIEGHEPRTKCP